ncbi:MAG: hypothetical protein ACJ79W_00885 [Myxococcales bacterium]|jgi:hypothetical protein
MKKLIPAIAAAALGIVSLAASPARADEHHDFRGHAPAPVAPARAMPVPRATPVQYYRHDGVDRARYEHERWEAERARHEHERWEAERARERRMLEERRAEFYSHRHNRWERRRFDAWYADRGHDLDRGLRIDIHFPF